MKYLLDTCVLSEFVKPKPSASLLNWLETTQEHKLAISVLSIGEIQKGISRMPPGDRRVALEQWLDDNLIPRFDHRILPVELKDVLLWGQLTGEAMAAGRTLPAVDAMLASMTISRGLILVTRNIRYFSRTPARILNPWE